MHDNSVTAYETKRPELTARWKAVYENIKVAGPAPDRFIARRMGFDHVSAVQPRISDLIKWGYLRERMEPMLCRETGVMVRVVEITKGMGNEKDWKEDAHLENGNYWNTCLTCGGMFVGHKRRIQCRYCEDNHPKK